MGGGACGSLLWDEMLGRAKGGAGLGDGRVCRESQEGRYAGTKCGGEHDDDVKINREREDWRPDCGASVDASQGLVSVLCLS